MKIIKIYEDDGIISIFDSKFAVIFITCRINWLFLLPEYLSLSDIFFNFAGKMFAMEHEFDVKELVEELVDVLEDKLFDLVVYNDDFNTFDHVINTLIKVCKHSPEQAEQCTYIIHYKGKCCVKKGGYPELEPMKNAILDAGIDAKIQ